MVAHPQAASLPFSVGLTGFVPHGTCSCRHGGGEGVPRPRRGWGGRRPRRQLVRIPSGCGGVSRGVWDVVTLRGVLMPWLLFFEDESWEQGSLIHINAFPNQNCVQGSGTELQSWGLQSWGLHWPCHSSAPGAQSCTAAPRLRERQGGSEKRLTPVPPASGDLGRRRGAGGASPEQADGCQRSSERCRPTSCRGGEQPGSHRSPAPLCRDKPPLTKKVLTTAAPRWMPGRPGLLKVVHGHTLPRGVTLTELPEVGQLAAVPARTGTLQW